MRILHLVKVRFDQRRPDIDQEWLERRFKFFFDNTYRSLRGQTSQFFILWINCQEGMERKVDTLNYWMPESRVGTAPATYFSFGDGPLPLSPEMLTAKPDYVYVTRIDSDDLFSPDALQVIESYSPVEPGRVEALVFQRGYLHDTKNLRTGVYFSHSPPFHTIMYPLEVFTDPKRYGEVFSRTGDHSRVQRELPSQVLPPWKFTVLVHENNFLSTFDYGREGGYVPKAFSTEQFLNPPVVFDVDDFSEKYGGPETLECLYKLKEKYPKFKCTLFGIPFDSSNSLLLEATKHDWIQVGVHGLTHTPNEELKAVTPLDLLEGLKRLPPGYASVFRPPGWYITKGHIETINRFGMGIALHKRDEKLTRYCKHGYYMCEDRFPYWHGHTHNVCNNWLKAELPKLLTRWTESQDFAFVTEALLVRT